LLNFQPIHLNEVMRNLQADFPLPKDFALKDEDSAFDIIERIRLGAISFESLSVSDFNYVYQLANLCTEEEFERLKNVFPLRITSNLFEIGWIYCQHNPDNDRAVQLFSDVCRWMKANLPDYYNDTLIGRTDLPWDEIFIRSVEIMRINKMSIDQFCEKFQIIPNTKFYHQLNIVYLSRCDKNELLQNEALLAELISTSKLELLRPTIRNYTAQIPYEEMSHLIRDSIIFRLSKESDDESIGLSPTMLHRIRSERFNSVIADNIINPAKQNVYNSISGRVKNVELLTKGFFMIDFGVYIVLDNTDWDNYAYAYTPSKYNELLDEWKEANYPEDFWPAEQEESIAPAREMVLGIKKNPVIKLGFTDFDILYTKDLLSFSRY
jgi:hypothetical protein